MHLCSNTNAGGHSQMMEVLSLEDFEVWADDADQGMELVDRDSEEGRGAHAMGGRIPLTDVSSQFQEFYEVLQAEGGCMKSSRRKGISNSLPSSPGGGGPPAKGMPAAGGAAAPALARCFSMTAASSGPSASHSLPPRAPSRAPRSPLPLARRNDAEVFALDAAAAAAPLKQLDAAPFSSENKYCQQPPAQPNAQPLCSTGHRSPSQPAQPALGHSAEHADAIVAQLSDEAAGLALGQASSRRAIKRSLW